MDEKQLRRLSDCEVLINKYYQEIQSYMKQIDNHEKNVLSKKEFYENMHVNKTMFYKELERLSLKQADLNAEIQKHDKKIEDNGQYIRNLDLLSKSFKHDIEQLFSHIDFLKHKNTESSSRIDSLNLRMPNREKIYQDHHELKKKFESLFDELQKDVDSLRNGILKQDAELKATQGKIVNANDMTIKRQSDSDMIMEQLKRQINEIKSVHQSDMYEMKKYINNIPSPEMPKLPNFEAIVENMKKSVMEKLEEESNKYVKALDISLLNEIQIKVLNKKIDSILAILEKTNFHR